MGRITNREYTEHNQQSDPNHIQTHTVPTHTEAMYVRQPKYQFGYHEIGISNNCKGLNRTHNLGLSKIIHSIKQPLNNLSLPKVNYSKKQLVKHNPPRANYPTKKQGNNSKKIPLIEITVIA